MRLRRQALLCLLGVVLGSHAFAAATGAAAAPVCRRAGVEWIVGGPTSADRCEAAAAPTSTAAPRWHDSDGAGERRRILEDELRREQDALAQALGQGAAADPAALGRTRANIAALQGELARLPRSR